jgi:hypothetical protein
VKQQETDMVARVTNPRKRAMSCTARADLQSVREAVGNRHGGTGYKPAQASVFKVFKDLKGRLMVVVWTNKK